MDEDRRIALFALIGLGAWIFVALPLIYLPPGAITNWLHNWQTLVAAGVALFAATLAFHNTTRSLKHSEELDAKRRVRKHAAIRAMLPLALADVTRYTRDSAAQLKKLVEQCEGESLPRGSATDESNCELPMQSLETFSEFIEYSDALEVKLLEAVLARIQIHDSRTRLLVTQNSEHSDGVVVRTGLESLIVDAAIIYAGATAYFNYARRYVEHPPRKLSWSEVESALVGLDVWNEDNPRISDAIERRRKVSDDPIGGVSFRSVKPRA